MINYDTALQLKDAGFRQSPYKFHQMCKCSHFTVETHGSWMCDCKPEDFIHNPTLSELIEACGEEGFHLFFDEGEWFATKMWHDPHIRGHKCVSNIRDEAVALLWLAINKK